MAANVVKSKVTAAKLLADMAHLSPRELDQIIQGASVLQLEKRRIVPSERESALMRQINEGLDDRKEAELETLREKVREETISNRERAHLLRLSDEIEQIAARRAQALIELAAIRKTTVQKLIRDLELTENAYA